MKNVNMSKRKLSRPLASSTCIPNRRLIVPVAVDSQSAKPSNPTRRTVRFCLEAFNIEKCSYDFTCGERMRRYIKIYESSSSCFGVQNKLKQKYKCNLHTLKEDGGGGSFYPDFAQIRSRSALEARRIARRNRLHTYRQGRRPPPAIRRRQLREKTLDTLRREIGLGSAEWSS